MRFSNTLIVGLKALAGSIISAIITWGLIGIFAFIFGETARDLVIENLSFMWVIVLLFFTLSIFIAGWTLHKFWGWN
jgi:hypothetical protein